MNEDYLFDIVSENCIKFNFIMSQTPIGNFSIHRKEDGLLMGNIFYRGDNIYETFGATTVSEYRQEVSMTDPKFHDRITYFIQSLKDHAFYKLKSDG